VLVPGLTEADFDEFAAAGIRVVKFIYYDYEDAAPSEAERYVAWSRARGIKVKIHTGGTSYIGESVVTGATVSRHWIPIFSATSMAVPYQLLAEMLNVWSGRRAATTK
jgi:hypothetical protein